IVQGSEEWTSPVVEEQLWPNARRSVIKENPVPIDWVDTNPLLLQLPSAGSWIMAENAGTEGVFSTSINADHARQETWIQIASSGDVDLLVNGHLITSAVASSTGGKHLPHLAAATAQSAQSREETHPGASAKGTVSPAKSTVSPFEPAVLTAYDISYWIKEGPNAIVAAVRSDHRPASLFANGLLVRKDDSIVRFETDSGWETGDHPVGHQLAQSHRAIELGKDGSAPWGYLSQELARPVDRPGFATLAKSCAVVLSTTVVIVALWLVLSAIAAGRRREPLAYAMSRDALFHGPIAAGLLLLLLPNYDPRFPTGWSFQPKFVIGAILAL
ncbi:MAG TPA: hypothetical protein DHU55_08490, partial [Blastocatellia bacterium]|nr:hypothetical protein [Blastocatellia bacterium]